MCVDLDADTNVMVIGGVGGTHVGHMSEVMFHMFPSVAHISLHTVLITELTPHIVLLRHFCAWTLPIMLGSRRI